MKIVIRSEDCTEVWDGILYKKLSDYPNITPWELRTLAEFVAYEKMHGRECEVQCEDEALLRKIKTMLDKPKEYLQTPRPALITECTACPQRRGCETAFVCHTTSPDNAKSILTSGRLLSAVKARGISGHELTKESRNAAGDPPDYFDYIMFAWGNCQGGDRLVTERRLGYFPEEKDLSLDFQPGIRFYFRYETLQNHPGVIFDGVLPMKIKDELSLAGNVCAIIIPETLRPEMEACIPDDLRETVMYIENDCADIWEWSEKVYSLVEEKCAGE